MVIDVGPATRQQEADPGLLRGSKNAIVVASFRVDVLVIDYRCGAAAEVLDETQHRGDVCVMLSQRLSHRPDGDLEPFEQRFVIGQAAQERLKQVGMSIHHAGHDGHVRPRR